MGVPLVYRKGTDPSITYSWTDIASGSGYQTFYLLKNNEGYALSDTKIYSDQILLNQAFTSETWAKDFDQAFTIPLNTNRTINGDVVAVIASTVELGSGYVRSLYYVVNVIKVAGTTETTLGTMSGATMTSGATLDHANTFNIKIPIVNQTIKEGEKLGIRLQAYGQSVIQTPRKFYLGLDPMGRTSTNDGAGGTESQLTMTTSSVNFPFRIDT
jgi:hypothetical protein